MKQIAIGQLSRREREDATNEVRILASLNSAFVIRYYDSFMEPDNQLNIVMEFAENGNLCDYLKVTAPARDHANGTQITKPVDTAIHSMSSRTAPIPPNGTRAQGSDA